MLPYRFLAVPAFAALLLADGEDPPVKLPNSMVACLGEQDGDFVPCEAAAEPLTAIHNGVQGVRFTTADPVRFERGGKAILKITANDLLNRDLPAGVTLPVRYRFELRPHGARIERWRLRVKLYNHPERMAEAGAEGESEGEIEGSVDLLSLPLTARELLLVEVEMIVEWSGGAVELLPHTIDFNSHPPPVTP